MVQICALASGSNGNCYYIGNETEAVLVDVGISNRMLVKRLKETKLSMAKIKGIFITHEHSDHIKGMRIVNEQNGIPVYSTEKTYLNTRKDCRAEEVNYFEAGDSIDLGAIKVHSFAKSHDAADPTGFRIEIDGKNVGVLTDLGTFNDEILKQMDLCQAIFLESNYDSKMLQEGKYPYYLKQRVLSNQGHLSNAQAVNLVKKMSTNQLQVLFLSHISADNNTIEKALESFKPFKKEVRIEACSRKEASCVIDLDEYKRMKPVQQVLNF